MRRDEGKRNVIVEREERLLVNKMRSLVPVLEYQMFSIKTEEQTDDRLLPKGTTAALSYRLHNCHHDR